MEDNSSPRSSEFKNVLPDVVHSQPIPTALGPVVSDETESNNNASATKPDSDQNEVLTEASEAESISDHVQDKLDYSLSESEVLPKSERPASTEGPSLSNSNRNNPIIPHIQSISSEIQDPSSSWLAEENLPEVNHISNESPLIMPASSESKEGETLKSTTAHYSDHSVAESSKNEFLDSLNDKTNSLDSDSISRNKSTAHNSLSNSEEIIKLDIRGSGVPKYQFPAAQIIFGPPPEGSEVVKPDVETIPVFPNLLSPFLVGGGDSAHIEELFDSPEMSKEETPVESFSDKEQDVLIEEMTVDETKEKKDLGSLPQPKSIPEDGSFSTFTTDYKTICEEYHEKLTHLEAAISERDQLIQKLNASLQQTSEECDALRAENEVLKDHDTVQGQLSDFMKYNSMINDTKFFPTSQPTSIHSNSEKDMENEEITVDHSRTSDSDLTGFDAKLVDTIAQYGIAENVQNQLIERLQRVFCDEVGKIKLESDTELRELESQLQQDKRALTSEARRLRELLATVKAGNADIEALRIELNIKHEKEMVNLRNYYEKMCSDIQRSYSEEVSRGKSCVSPTSCSSLEGQWGAGAGDAPRRRTRSAELPSLGHDSNVEQAAKLHADCVNEIQRHKEAITTLEDQIVQLKAHIQTTENTEHNVTLYQQDIDLELEKELDLERIRQEIREQVSQELEKNIQVLLADPDAELSSWPPELVALWDKIHADLPKGQEKELSASLQNEADGADKWRQKRNHSFDQNRHLEQVTKERDDLKRVAMSLQRMVSQLVSYCAAADDELNKTVLAELLQRALYTDNPNQEDPESRPETPNLSIELNSSWVSRARGRRVHFAPELPAVLAELDEEQLLAYLQEQRDLSLDIKRELELSLVRLRNEAQELLDLSTKLGKNKGEYKMLQSSQVKITELVDEIELRQHCSSCEMLRKNMEEAMSEALQREGLLRADLEEAMMRIAQLIADTQGDLVAEGYGLVGARLGHSLPARGAPRGSPPDSRSVSLDASPRNELTKLTHELEELHREKEDLRQQLEAANRQLRSSRQFIEEQATEREAERDEYTKAKDELRRENSELASRLKANARILNEMRCLNTLKLSTCNCRQHDAHVEQLEAQMREMNQMIAELETHKANADKEVKASNEKISILKDINANYEQQLEEKIAHEAEVLRELGKMRKTIDERDAKLRELVGELEALRSERAEASAFCSKCAEVEESDLLGEIKEQARWLEVSIHHRTKKLEKIHETSSAPCSEPSEDMSLADQRNYLEAVSGSPSPRAGREGREGRGGGLLGGVWGALEAQARAAHAALKHVADLTRAAQEVRAERDVLQARMSEQALQLSSLAAKLQLQRSHAEAAAQTAAGDLSVKLHDALAEVQRLTDEVDAKNKQLSRLKQSADERKNNDKFDKLYGNTSKPQEKVLILEKELTSTRTRISHLEKLVTSLEEERDAMREQLRESRRCLAEREDQLQEILALKLDEENQKSENRTEDIIIEGAKTSARTLSDIVSISDYDEQDLQMRKAELKHNMSLNAPYPDNKEKSLNKTLPPDLQKPNMSSLNIDYTTHFDFTNTPRADSLPIHLTSTQNRENNIDNRVVNKTESQKIHDNCSMYPNRNISDSKDKNLEPKKIDFSIEPDNKTDEFTSLRELGIALDIKQENFPDILSQLKHEIKKSKSELDLCKSELKNAEEQLCEFPALKEEVEALKNLLENTMVTMEKDKKFYEKQLENFTSNKTLLEKRLSELTQEVNDKTKDLHLLKEDILRRENMVLELAKEKRNLTNKMTELEIKIDELQSRNTVLEKYEKENSSLREKANELKKLEQLVTEKNQQIDSLNQHLDRLDDMQRRLDDKTEEVDNMKEIIEEKSNELFQMQDTIEALNRDLANVHEDNEKLNISNKDLKQKLTKVEKEQENQSLKQQSNENELERLSLLNNELTNKIDELKLLTEKLKDKETEIEMLNEDIASFHEEIASLKDQLKMVSRSPSPKKEGKAKVDRPASNDKKELVRIRKQISLLQHELDFNKKELNEKAFELARAKLDLTELTANLSSANKQVADTEAHNKQLEEENRRLEDSLEELREEKSSLEQQLQLVMSRMREESNTSELKQKLQAKTEQCHALERELIELRDELERSQEGGTTALVLRGSRSPTAELERALRDTLDYSTRLDEDIMDQILSASSDNEDIPRLALNSSRSTSIHSSSSELVRTLRAEKEKLALQVASLEARVKDKDALIAELNRVREQLAQECAAAMARGAAERGGAARLQLLLDAHKDAAETAQKQDTNMIQILKKRLESAMASELELQKQLQELKARTSQLERQLLQAEPGTSQLKAELENNERLKGEMALLRSKLDLERTRYLDLQAELDQHKLQLQRQLDEKTQIIANLRAELLDAQRLKHAAAVELVRAKELLGLQSCSLAELRGRPRPQLQSELQSQKSDLAKEMATLKQCLLDSNSDQSSALRQLKMEKAALEEQVGRLQARTPDDRDQAIRYLHSRCLRLESCRKALVWQKRYLQRVAAGYAAIEASMAPAGSSQTSTKGVQKFRCVARAVTIVFRMSFLVRRRRALRAAAAPLAAGAGAGGARGAREPRVSSPLPPSSSSPPSREPPAQAARRPAPRLRPDMRLNLVPDSPFGDYYTRSPCFPNSPRVVEEPFLLGSTPRSESAAAYLNKLELVSRCLNQAMDAKPVP